jgi:hypothetical protein
VARRLSTDAVLDAVLDAAPVAVPRVDRPELRQAATSAIHDGKALLVLDSLDEVTVRRPQLLRELSSLLVELHPANEVLVDVTYAEAHTLGLPDLRLEAASSPGRAARAVLRAVAQQRRLPRAAAWIDRRSAWVDERLRTDRAPGRTPLMAVLLALLASDDDEQTLPRSRALILAKVIREVVERWEAGVRLDGREPQLASLLGSDAVRAAHAAFTVIGALVFDASEAAMDVTVEELREQLAEPFGLAPQPATSVAEAAVALWDDAGVFVATGAPRPITAPIQLVAELAFAQRMVGAPDEELRRWFALDGMGLCLRRRCS